MNKKEYFLLVLFFAAFSCKRPYNPLVKSQPGGYLVVEGEINSGADSTVIKLSRTVSVNSTTTTKPELNATVTVQGDQNVSYPLTATGNGNYACAGLNLDNTHNYRLSIATSNSEQYLSDYEPVLNAPPIDSVSFDTKGTPSAAGLNVYVNSHDPTGKVLYYRWDYQETWIFHANFASAYESNGDTVLARNLSTDNITDCWKSDTSSSIYVSSSAKLSKDVIAQFPITSILSTSEKIGDEYSILVRQYALTPDAYNFYVNLKKNTEQMGSIFDAEPSEIAGNIHSVDNPTEPVIGYVSVGATTNQRIFVTTQQLPHWVTIPFYTDCKLEFDYSDPVRPVVCCYYAFTDSNGNILNQVNEYINYNAAGYYDPSPYIPISALGPPGLPPIGYTASTRECVDCTLRGTNKQPAFWK